MDDLTAYYAPPIHHPYYQPPPPPPPGTVLSAPITVAEPIHVQPQFVAYAPPIYPQSSNDQVRTLFVAGLPEDVKPREIYNLFRDCPGYQSSNLRPPTSSNNQVCPWCFVYVHFMSTSLAESMPSFSFYIVEETEFANSSQLELFDRFFLSLFTVF